MDSASLKSHISTKSTHATLSTKSKLPSVNLSSSANSSIIIQESENQNDDTASGSTTQGDTPPPSYLSTKNPSGSHSSHLSLHSNNPISERPSTPTTSITTRSALARKRSLTLLSPQKITTRSTRELKRKSSGRTDESSLLSVPSSRMESTTSTSQIIERALNDNSKS